MAAIRTNPHHCDWHWRQPHIVAAPKRVVMTGRGAYIVAITEHNPENGPCWLGVPAEQDSAGDWVEKPGVGAHSVTVMNRVGVDFVA